jgi:hypothetical protein
LANAKSKLPTQLSQSTSVAAASIMELEEELVPIDLTADELASLTTTNIAYSAPIASINYWLTPSHDLAMTNAAAAAAGSHHQQQYQQYVSTDKLVAPVPIHAVSGHLTSHQYPPVYVTQQYHHLPTTAAPSSIVDAGSVNGHSHGGHHGHVGNGSNLNGSNVSTAMNSYAFALPYDPFGDMFDVDTTGLGSPDPFSPDSATDSPYNTTIDDDSLPSPLPVAASMAALLAAVSTTSSLTTNTIPSSSSSSIASISVQPLPPLPPVGGTSIIPPLTSSSSSAPSAPLPQTGGRTRPASNSNSSTTSNTSNISSISTETKRPPAKVSIKPSAATATAAKKDANKGKKIPRKKAPKCKCLGWNPECLVYDIQHYIYIHDILSLIHMAILSMFVYPTFACVINRIINFGLVLH